MQAIKRTFHPPRLSLSWAVLFLSLRFATASDAPSYQKFVSPFLAKHCSGCHGEERQRAGLNLHPFTVEGAGKKSVIENRGIWESMLEKLRSRKMPPPRRPQPSEEERMKMVHWIDSALGEYDCSGPVDPGRVTIRRLNRDEYNNTIRDLTGLDLRPADDFPADDVGYGFDNIGDVLSLSPLLLERFLKAAEMITERALGGKSGGGSAGARGLILTPRPEGELNLKEKLRWARENLRRFTGRAYRRPATGAEVDRLVRLVEKSLRSGDHLERGIQLALQAVLVSPYFLFRVEPGPEGAADSGKPIQPLGAFEVASRLSYFLWSSMPDEELFEHARDGTLLDEKILEDQVRRMLKDPRSGAFVKNFAGQWLQIRNLETASPDPDLFRDFDEELRKAMFQETALFFEAVLRENRSILDFLDSDFTFLNERLARHYNISGVQGKDFKRVKIPDRKRGGILTQASILTITSNPTRTSPVKRGKYVLEQLLGTPPPPPPPEAGELSEDPEVVRSESLRKRMELHRSKPGCSSCHSRMDPIGFGLENFDAIGAWRERDGKFPIDPSGTLPSGESFNGPAELKAILKRDREKFARCLAEKMLIFALGRGLEYYDRCAVDQLLKALRENEYKIQSLVLEIVKTTPFRMRRGASWKE